MGISPDHHGEFSLSVNSSTVSDCAFNFQSTKHPSPIFYLFGVASGEPFKLSSLSLSVSYHERLPNKLNAPYATHGHNSLINSVFHGQ